MTQYSDDTLRAVKSFGLLSYPIDMMLTLITELTSDDIDDDTFTRDMKDETTPLYKAYHKGQTLAEYNIDKKLYDMATKDGDLTALETLERRQRIRSIDKDD